MPYLPITEYASQDKSIIQMARKLKLVLIGGTAMELLAKHFNNADARIRSKNDFDFILGTDAPATAEQIWKHLKGHRPEIIHGGLDDPLCTISIGHATDWAEIDILKDYENQYQTSALTIEGLKVVNPKEQLRMKQERLRQAYLLSQEKVAIEKRDIALLKSWVY